MIDGKCKKCGRMLHVEEGLLSFSCMYCGEKLKYRDLLITDKECDPAEADVNFSFAMEHILSCVTEHRDIMKHFNRDEYIPSFTGYLKSCHRVFSSLNNAAIMDAGRRDHFITSLTDHFISTLEADWEKQPGWDKKKTRTAIMENDKMIIAIYLVPMVEKLSLAVSGDFNTTLQRAWAEKFPKNVFYIGNFEKITESYNRRLKTCFITTAVCRDSMKPDDCYELEALRNYRDNWLAHSPGGGELIREYYRIAPFIVTAMDLTGGDYKALEREYITPCVRDIEAGNMETCRDRYVKMVRSLEARYLKN
jgi:hypothetical protein